MAGSCIWEAVHVGIVAWGSYVGSCACVDCGASCVGELGGAVWGGGLCGGHAHQLPDGLDIHTPLPAVVPAQWGFPLPFHQLPPILPLPAALSPP